MTRRFDNHVGWATAAGAVGLALGIQTAVRFSRRISFRGKTVLITGGSRGLGLVLARQFAREGASVAICARDEDELNDARRDIQRFGIEQGSSTSTRAGTQSKTKKHWRGSIRW